MKRIVVLISGRGTNLLSLAQSIAEDRWRAQIVGVISDGPDAPGLRYAKQYVLETEVVDFRSYAVRADFDRALAAAIDRREPDFVVLAGFMRVLGREFVDHYAGRLLNIHPSLLPAFPGLHTHRRALEAGVAVHGATVHLVGHEVDSGPIIAQAALAVGAGDDETRLASRVLALEHRLYPMALRWFVEDRVRVEDGRVVLVEPREGDARCLWGG